MSGADWLAEITRWGQVNFSERDAEEFDVEFWRSYWRQARLQAVTVTVGGPVAYYPTKIPHHRPSEFARSGRDIFGETVRAAKEDGLRVLARLDPTFMSAELLRAHPEWAERNADGEARGGNSVRPDPEDPGRHLTEFAAYGCYNGPHFAEYTTAIMREVMSSYDIDGFFTNAWPKLSLVPPSAASVCWCESCRGLWDEFAAGRPLPSVAAVTDPDWRLYVAFVQQRVEAVQEIFRSTVHEMLPHGSFVSTAYPSAGTGLRWDRWIDLIDALFSDSQGRRNPQQPGPAAESLWEVGFAGKLHRAVANGKPIVHLLAAYLFRRYRHATPPATELRLEFGEAAAHGELPKWHVLGGAQLDRRWMPAADELGQRLQQLEPVLHGRNSLAEVAVLWSPHSVHLDSWGVDGRADHGEALLGWHRALLGARIPYDIVHEDFLDDVDRYRVLVLPSGLTVSPATLERLRVFRRGGGHIISVADALARGPWAEPVDGALLTDILPVTPAGDAIGPLTHSYIDVSAEPADTYGAKVLAGGRWLQPVLSNPPADAHGTWISDYPLHPTHASYPAETQDGHSVLIEAERATLIAMDIDAQFIRFGIPDHAAVLTRAVRRHLGGPSVVELSGDGLVDITAWSVGDLQLAVWIVNLDTPSLSWGYVDQIRPLSTRTLSILIPEGKGVTSVRASGGDALAWVEDGATLEVTVPQVDDYEVVIVDLIDHPSDADTATGEKLHMRTPVR